MRWVSTFFTCRHTQSYHSFKCTITHRLKLQFLYYKVPKHWCKNWHVRIFTLWNPCWASFGWLDLTFVFILPSPAHGPEGGMLVRIYSAWSKMSWAPAAKCTPSPTASSEMLLRNATVPGEKREKTQCH